MKSKKLLIILLAILFVAGSAELSFASKVGSLNEDSTEIDAGTANNETNPSTNDSSNVTISDESFTVEVTNDEVIYDSNSDINITDESPEEVEDQTSGESLAGTRWSDYFTYGVRNDSSTEVNLYSRLDLNFSGSFTKQVISAESILPFRESYPCTATWLDDNNCYVFLDKKYIVGNGRRGIKFKFTLPDGNYTVTGRLRTVASIDTIDSFDSFDIVSNFEESKRSNILDTQADSSNAYASHQTVYKVTVNNIDYDIPYGETILDKLPILSDSEVESFNGYEVNGEKLTSTAVALAPITVTPLYKSKMILPGREFNKVLKQCISEQIPNTNFRFRPIKGSYNSMLIQYPTIKYYDVSEEHDMSTVIFKNPESSDICIMSKYIDIIFNTDSSHLFYEVTNLTSANMIWDTNKVITNHVTDMSNMFYGCSGLTSLDLSMFNTSNVENMCGMFTHCTSLNNLTQNFDTSKVKTFESLFAYTAFSQIDVTNFNTSSATTMSNMFGRMQQLTSIDIGNFDTRNVINISAMFENDISLINLVGEENLDLSNCDTMRGMFKGCSILEAIDVSDWNVSKVNNMGCIFFECRKLKTVDVSKWNTQNVAFMDGLFYRCDVINNIDVSNFNTSKVVACNLMFGECLSLVYLDVSNFDLSNCEEAQGMFTHCRTLNNIDVTNFKVSSKMIDIHGMFEDCWSFTSIDIRNWDTSSVTNTSYMFNECKSLTQLLCNPLDFSSCIDATAMFRRCEKITSIHISNCDFSNVQRIGSMFYKCESATHICVPTNMHNVVVADTLFSECVKLNSVNLDVLVLSKCEYMGYMFYNCRSLVNINIQNMDTRKVRDFSCMFQYCYGTNIIYGSNFLPASGENFARMMDTINKSAPKPNWLAYGSFASEGTFIRK